METTLKKEWDYYTDEEPLGAPLFSVWRKGSSRYLKTPQGWCRSGSFVRREELEKRKRN